MVQPPARIRLPDLRGGDAGYLCPYGDAAPVRDDRTQARSVCPGAVRAGLQRHDGGRNSPGNRLARSVFALARRRSAKNLGTDVMIRPKSAYHKALRPVPLVALLAAGCLSVYRRRYSGDIGV